MKWDKSVRSWVVPLLFCAAGAVLPVRAQIGGTGVAGTPKPPANAAAAKAKASLEPLLKQASEALDAGQIRAAREAFADAVTLDPRNARATHGLALCLLYSKDTRKACTTFDKAIGLSPKPDRALVLNAAAAHSADRNNARAAKIIKDYLTANPKEVDEPMVNALGTALMAATPQERRNRLFAEAATFYEQANKKLEAARPGFKRFGSQWLPAAEAEAKHRTLAAQQRQIDMLEEAVGTAEEQVEPALKELERQKDLIRRGEPPNNYYFRQADSAYNGAVARYQTAVENLEKATANVERPKFPEAIALVGIEDVKAPEVARGSDTAIASAANTGSFTVTRPRIGSGTGTRTGPMKLGGTGRGGNTTTTDTDNTAAGGDKNNPLAGGARVVYEPPKPTRKARVTQYAAAFPIAPDLAVTSAAAVDDRATLQLMGADGQGVKASLVRKDDTTGLALIRIEGGGKKLVPLMLADDFKGGAITCCSFPTVDLFNPSGQRIAGNAPAPKDGAEWTVTLGAHPRLAGAPLLSGTKVVGVCVAPRDAEKNRLPAVTLSALKQFIADDAKPAAAPGDPMSNLLQLVSTRETGE